ncbi:MAG: hypothetical protein Q9201_003978 [Fulgogasparrea decipioides]
MDTIQSSLFALPQHLNHLTGYTPIESLKASIDHQEKTLETCRVNLAAARTAYSSAIKTRSSSQREVNELLQRKHIWTPTDLERFTSLYRSDHSNEIKENEAHEALVRAEKEAEEAGARLSEGILKRYHEEQIWSDKIRRMSTWGTWGLMGVNVKRQIEQQEMESQVSTSQRSMFDYKHLKDTFKDLFSDRQVSVRRWDLTALVLEGAAAGMAAVGLIAMLLRPR